ncbi:MAG: LysR family transcriptional regulator [Acidimicrobiales bacterium]
MPLPHPVPDLSSLDLLQSVAVLGSIRRAAQAHHISQPAASMKLRSLESCLGLRLLERSSTGARLTTAGDAVVEWSEPVLEGMKALHIGTSALRSKDEGHLAVAASMTVAEYLIPGWIARIAEMRPGLSISLKMGNSLQVAEMVESNDAVVGFVEGKREPSSLHYRKISTDSLVVVVAPSHSWAHRRAPLSAAEISHTAFVLREPGSGTREVLESALEERGLQLLVGMELGSTTAIKAAVVEGVGPAALSHLAVRSEMNDGRLVAVPVADLDLGRTILAVWSRSRSLSHDADDFLSRVKAMTANSTRRRSEVEE